MAAAKPRAAWTGTVTFGLASVPVKAYSATDSHDVRFHQVRASDGSRIKQKRVAAADGAEVGYDEITKGFETEDGEQVVLTDDDLATLPCSTSNLVEVIQFVPADQVDPLLLDKSYFLGPAEKVGATPYALLREALVLTDRMAVVKLALRQRETMAVLRVRGELLVLQTLLWVDEVREPVTLDPVELRPQELHMAVSLVDSLSENFHPEQFHDEYRDAVVALIESKRTKKASPAPSTEVEDSLTDLLTALQHSVAAKRAS